MKEYIKSLVKESLGGLLKEKSKTQTTDSDKEGKKDDQGKEEEVQYNDIKNFFDKHSTITKVGVFREAGFTNDEIYQRLPYKKLDNEKNEMGGVYRFNKDEVDRIRTVLDKYPT